MTWNHEWVSVKEKLPTSEEIFIVTVLDESGDIPWSYVTTGWYLREADCWIVDNEKTRRVVAWMSMPLPWKKPSTNVEKVKKGRYIDAEKLKKDLVHRLIVWSEQTKGMNPTYGESNMPSIIDEQPTADVREVRHGHWIYKGNRGRFPACECSVCGNVENADWAILGDNVSYCPNCGAKMEIKNDNA